MKKVIIGIVATALLAAAATFGYSKVTAKEDCCQDGSACCYPGSSCCVKK